MERKISIPSRFTLSAAVLAGCASLAVSVMVFGQADSRNPQERQPASQPGSPSMESQADHKTIEGKLVSLFDALAGPSADHGSDMPGKSEEPATSRQPGFSTQPGSPTQPGSLTQPGSSTAQFGAGMSPVAQPLALISDSGSTSPESTLGAPSTTGAGRPSTPGRNLPEDRPSPPTAEGDSSQSMDQGELYVLVFDPADPQSRSAYLMAQAIAQSRSRADTSIGAPGARGTPRTSSPDTSATERQPDHDRTSTSMSDSTHGEQVRVTGRIIEREGVQAIAVHKVERQSDASPSSSSPSSPGAQ